MNGKPDWKDAPEWAKFLAMDRNGDWYWYEDKPFVNSNERQGTKIWTGTRRAQLAEKSSNQWKETLEERPK